MEIKNLTPKKMRLLNGYKLEDIAKKLGTGTSNYCQMENGNRAWQQKYINKLLAIYKCKYEDIFLSNNIAKSKKN